MNWICLLLASRVTPLSLLVISRRSALHSAGLSLGIFPSVNDPLGLRDSVLSSRPKISTSRGSLPSEKNFDVPYAPVQYLVPVVRLLVEIEKLQELRRETPSYVPPNDDDYPLLLTAKVSQIRKYFNAYTGALLYGGDRYELTAKGEQRKELIRSDALPVRSATWRGEEQTRIELRRRAHNIST